MRGSDYPAESEGPPDIPLVLDVYHQSSVWFSSLRNVLPLTKRRSNLQSEKKNSVAVHYPATVRLLPTLSFFLRNAFIPWSLVNRFPGFMSVPGTSYQSFFSCSEGNFSVSVKRFVREILSDVFHTSDFETNFATTGMVFILTPSMVACLSMGI